MPASAKKNLGFDGLALRPFHEGDFDAAEQIVRELWHSDENERVARVCARQELAYHLDHALARIVAADGGVGDPHAGEAQLLIVSARARGMHVGTASFNEATAILSACGCARFRLATDEGCDWGYYKHIGMRRVGEGTSDALVGSEGGPFSLYVYEEDLPLPSLAHAP